MTMAVDPNEIWPPDHLAPDPDSDDSLYGSLLILKDRETWRKWPHPPLSSLSEGVPSTAYCPTSQGPSPPPSPCFPILELPSEIRIQIYEYALADLRPKSRAGWWFSVMNGKLPPAPCPALLLANRQVAAEAIPIYFGTYDFQFSSMTILKSFLQERSLRQLASIKHITVAAHPKLDFKTFDYEDDVKAWRLLVERCTNLKELWFEIMMSSGIYRHGVAGMEVLNDLRGLRGGGVIESLHGKRVEIEFEWMERLRELWKMPKPVPTGIAS